MTFRTSLESGYDFAAGLVEAGLPATDFFAAAAFGLAATAFDAVAFEAVVFSDAGFAGAEVALVFLALAGAASAAFTAGFALARAGVLVKSKTCLSCGECRFAQVSNLTSESHRQ